MKKFLCLLLSTVMVLSFNTAAFAENTITIVDEEKTEEKVEEKVEEKSEDSKTEEKETTVVTPLEKKEPATLEVTPQTTFVALGADLSAAQRQTVLSYMNLSEEKLANCNVVYVTNAEEHEHLDKYLGKEIIGHNSLSSVLVRPATTGHGVTVNTINITFCTPAMYQNALITAGVTDADVLVVGPSPISGTAALIGALKAYSEMSGKSVDTKALDVALDEIVTTGEVKDAIGDDEVASELISYVKAQVAANDLNTEEEIEAAVRQGDKEFNANLSEEQIKQIVDVMLRIKEMGIDFDVLAEQADEIYAKYGEQIKAGTFNINDVDWKDLGIGKIISKSFNKDFGKSLGTAVESIKKFIDSLSAFFK